MRGDKRDQQRMRLLGGVKQEAHTQSVDGLFLDRKPSG